MMRYLEDYDHENTVDEKKRLLLKFAFTKRTIVLSQTFIKFAIAWGWRDFINALIEAVYGVDSADEAVSAYWGFYFVIALFVAISFAFSDSFHILYPKQRMTSGQAVDEWLESVSRKQVNAVIYDNLRFVV